MGAKWRAMFIMAFYLLPVISFSQSWNLKQNFGGTARTGAVGFSIGNKGYIGTGKDITVKQDFWEWDQTTNVWSQKAPFSGGVRWGAVGFSIGNKGYIGTGKDGAGAYKQDFWQYDPAANLWIQKANFGGTARYLAVGFSIGAKGYIGTGMDGGLKQDFWEYDPALDTWTQKLIFGGTARYYATGFSIGTKGYIGTGNDGTNKKDFWEYDTGSGSWIQKSNFGGTARWGAVGFSIGTKGYIGTGYDNSFTQDLWEYDPASDLWTLNPNFGGTARESAVGFSIGNLGYIGTGQDGPGTSYKSDFWEYGSNTAISVTVASTNALCWKQCSGKATATTTGGSSPYTYYWVPGGKTTSSVTGLCAGNYIVHVTDAANDTATATVIITEPAALTATATSTPAGCSGNTNGTATANPSGGTLGYTYSWSATPIQTTQTATGLPAGNYTVTVADANGCTVKKTVTVVSSGNITATAGPNSTICAGRNTTLTASGGESYSWNIGKTSTSITVSPTINTTYTVTVTNSTSGCTGTATATVNVNPTPTVSITPIIFDTIVSDTICQGESVMLNAYAIGGIGYTYSWDPSGGLNCTSCSNPTFFMPAFQGNKTFTVTVSSSAGCTGKTTITIHVEPAPLAPTVTAKPNPICSGQTLSLSASNVSGGLFYFWLGPNSYTSISQNPTIPKITTAASGTYSVFALAVNSCPSPAGTVSVTVTPAPNASISVNPASASICSGNSATLIANGDGTYSWSNGKTTNTIIVSPTATTGYTVTVTNNTYGCTNTASVSVIVNPRPNITVSAEPDTICPGDSSLLTAWGGLGYWWLPPINTTATGLTVTVTVSPTTTTSYIVAGGIYISCLNLDTVTVVVSSITADAGIDQTICPGSTAQLVATAIGGVWYEWVDVRDSLICIPSSDPNCSVNPDSTATYYYVMIKDNNGCKAYDSVFVAVEYTGNCTDICDGIYNGITPNGDGANDAWWIDGIRSFPNHVYIFNRWGDRVWMQNNYNNEDRIWKGTNDNGEKLPSGTYYYVIELFHDKKKITCSGWVELTP